MSFRTIRRKESPYVDKVSLHACKNFARSRIRCPLHSRRQRSKQLFAVLSVCETEYCFNFLAIIMVNSPVNKVNLSWTWSWERLKTVFIKIILICKITGNGVNNIWFSLSFRVILSVVNSFSSALFTRDVFLVGSFEFQNVF